MEALEDLIIDLESPREESKEDDGVYVAGSATGLVKSGGQGDRTGAVSSSSPNVGSTSCSVSLNLYHLRFYFTSQWRRLRLRQ